ncbi:acetyl-CoA synthetase-like protein [Meredithblackwellia eburnea MCA 4105]
MVPDYPRLPPSYSFKQRADAATSVKTTLQLRQDNASWNDREIALRAAVALVLASHAGVEFYEFGVGRSRVRGELNAEGTLGDLLGEVRRDEEGEAEVRLVMEWLGLNRELAEDRLQVKTPLHLVVSAGIAAVNLELLFDSLLLPALEAEWLLSHVTSAYKGIISTPKSTLLTEISLFYPSTASRPSELQLIQQLSRSPAPPYVYPPSCNTLPSFFLHSLSLFPDSPALQFDSQVLSFSQLHHLASYFARHLLSHGVRPRTIVPLCIEKSIEMIVSMLGILLAGCGYLNLEPAFPAARKEGILRELCGTELWCGVGVISSDPTEEKLWKSWSHNESPLLETVDVVQALRPLLCSLDSLETVFTLPTDPLPIPDPTDAAYLIYTSGSTGAPKGIIVEHRNVSAFLRNYRGVFGRAPGERVLQFPSYSFDVSIMNIWDTFAHGSTLCMTSQSSLLSDLAGSVLRLGCTLVDLTPTVGALLFEHPDAQPRDGETVRQAWERAGFRIKVVNTGGEKVERWVRDAWLERGVRVVIDYGPTETTVGVISNQRTTSDTPVVPIGRPTGNNIIHILSDSLESVPLGCIGEIVVAGDQVTRGYVKSSLNEGVFIDHPSLGRLYRTGDLGRFLADGLGNIECLGRKDGQVKVNGLRIEVGEIEQHLTSALHPGIARGVVDRLERSDLAPGLIAFVVPSPSHFEDIPEGIKIHDSEPFVLPTVSSPDFRSLVEQGKQGLAKALPPYMVPRYWLPVSRIPTQGMGKADRKTLGRLASDHEFLSTSRAHSARRDDDRPQAVRRAWARVLHVDESTIEDADSFVRLGGDSIGFMKVISILRSSGFPVSFGDLVDATTLSECAERVKTEVLNSAPDLSYSSYSLLPSGTRDSVLGELDREYDLSVEDVDDVLPTAPPQDAILSASIDSDKYYAQAVYKLNQSLPVELLQSSLDHLVARHPVLRTCFAVVESLNFTLQVVLKPKSRQVMEASKLHRVSSTSSTFQKTLEEWQAADRRRNSFHWGHLSLSFGLFEEIEGPRWFCWNMHHAMSDGWTLELLSSDLRDLFHSFELPERLPFAAVTQWYSQSSLASDEQVEDFWKGYLQGARSLDWPNSPGAPLSTSQTRQEIWSGDLPGLSKRHGITPAIASRVAIVVALSHLAQKSDLTVGIVRSGRDIDLPGADEIVGPCVSALPSRYSLNPSDSLIDILHREASHDRRIRSHQNIALSRLLSICDFPSRSSLFDILITFQSLAEREEEEEKKAPWPIRQPPHQIRMPTNYALSFEVTPERDDRESLELACFFDPNVLEECEVDNALSLVAKVLDTLTIAPCTRLVDLNLTKEGGARPQHRPYTNGNHITPIELPTNSTHIDALRQAWADVLRLPAIELELDDTWGSAGGDSIGMMRLSAKLNKLQLSIPLPVLATLPTLRMQAQWLLQTHD